MQKHNMKRQLREGSSALHIPPSCPNHLQLVAAERSEKRHTDKEIFEPQYLLVWVCFFYHFLVSPQVMYHGGCILFARHSFTAAPPILSPIPHKSPLRLCASVGSVARLRLAVPRSSFSSLSPAGATQFLLDRKCPFPLTLTLHRLQ